MDAGEPLSAESSLWKGTALPQAGDGMFRKGGTAMSCGTNAFAALFPGLFEEIEQAGAVPADFSTSDILWFHHGVVKVPSTAPILMRCIEMSILPRILR